MTIDFAANMKVDSVYDLRQGAVQWYRTGDSLQVIYAKDRSLFKEHHLVVEFHGGPQVAKNAPWDGGMVWSVDSNDRPFVGMACQNLGASFWLPCHDDLDDEPDRGVHMTISIMDTNLTAVGNGKLISKTVSMGESTFEWEVKSPINPYNITANIGDYVLIEDRFKEDTISYPLSYYVLRDHYKEAVLHFQQVKPMLKSYQELFGPYPFREDGFKVVESPFWGMEHQSSLAYGNGFKNNAYGFDFILVHEAAHEYWGNSVSCRKPDEFWMHEAFATYTEALYLEKMYGKDSSLKYLLEQRVKIKNDHKMEESRVTSTDMYYKGAWMLHTMRNTLNNDYLWFQAIYELAEKYEKKNMTSIDMLNHFVDYLGLRTVWVMDQYLSYEYLPVLEYEVLKLKKRKAIVRYRLVTEAEGLELPFVLKKGDKAMRYTATTLWNKSKLKAKGTTLELLDYLSLIEVKKVDP
jgi:aminopeptidase N